MTTTVTTAWERIERWLGEHAPPVLSNLAPGATEDSLAALERAIGIALPAELRESLRRHDGQRDEFPGFVGGWELLSCRRIEGEWKIWKGLLDGGELTGPSTPADPRLKNAWWSPGWIPVTSSGSGNHHCVDADPAPSGQAGQVLVLWHDDAARPFVAPTVGDWLAQIATGLESGSFSVFEESGDWILEPGGFLLE